MKQHRTMVMILKGLKESYESFVFVLILSRIAHNLLEKSQKLSEKGKIGYLKYGIFKLDI